MSNVTISSAHTPAPWIAEYHGRGHWGIALSDGSHIGAVGDGWNDGGSDENLAANARLVAAAPELLVALKDALVALDFAAKRDPEQAGLYYCPIAREAIAKAA